MQTAIARKAKALIIKKVLQGGPMNEHLNETQYIPYYYIR
jgi:hypothetical protein